MSEQQKIIQPQAGFQERFVRSNVDFVVGGGVLNPQPIDALVATPNGFVEIGKLKAGDIVFDANGETQYVNFVINKGIQPCVEFTLSDGRKVRAALTHHWKVKERHGCILDVSSQEIIDYIEKERGFAEGRKHKHVNLYRIPMCKPCKFGEKIDTNKYIHPYVLGYILGNGCVSDKAHTMYISTSDKEVVEHIQSFGYSLCKSYSENSSAHYEFRGKGFRQLVKDSGIYGMISENKRIPEMYKNASLEDRYFLLQGLFDSDGSCEKKSGQASYKSISLNLIKDIQDIIYSIGGIANYTKNEAKPMAIRGKLYNCHDSYTIRVRIEDDSKLFWLQRKKTYARHNNSRRQQLYLSITDYRIIEDCEVCCINVSGNEHLYLTDNYVVTRNCGKSFAAVLSVAEASTDGNFRGLFLRNNLADARASGGILDTFKECYGNGCSVVESGEPRVSYPSGAKIDVTHVADQSRDKILQRFKGRQYDYIYFDEGTGFSWECFTAIYTRNRGTAKWTGKVRMTTNPDRNHWLRTFLDWYIGVDGFIREDREGVVRYFYMAGETVKDVVWGDTKEECYQQCKIDIDRKLRKINGKTGKATYEDMIKSFTFYLGRISENKASIGNNSGYVGSVAVAGGRNAEQLLEGNWNVSPSDSLDAPIPSDMANQVFVNDPCVNGDRWVTCDLADTGTDNFLCLAWDGFHVIDSLILGKTTPRQNAEQLQMFAEHHDVSDSHIIYDAIRGTYINDYIPDAIPFFSYAHPMGVYGRMARQLKDECYMRLIEMIKRGDLSISEKVGTRIYEHQKLKENITIQNEFIEECAVVRFKEVQNGKKTLLSKREMNQKLGKGRSMDLLDPCAMRMLPVLHLPYGDERIGSAIDEDDEDEETDAWGQPNSIYEDSTWC